MLWLYLLIMWPRILTLRKKVMFILIADQEEIKEYESFQRFLASQKSSETKTEGQSSGEPTKS